jgi:hypothetical protein
MKSLFILLLVFVGISIAGSAVVPVQFNTTTAKFFTNGVEWIQGSPTGGVTSLQAGAQIKSTNDVLIVPLINQATNQTMTASNALLTLLINSTNQTIVASNALLQLILNATNQMITASNSLWNGSQSINLTLPNTSKSLAAGVPIRILSLGDSFALYPALHMNSSIYNLVLSNGASMTYGSTFGVGVNGSATNLAAVGSTNWFGSHFRLGTNATDGGGTVTFTNFVNTIQVGMTYGDKLSVIYRLDAGAGSFFFQSRTNGGAWTTQTLIATAGTIGAGTNVVTVPLGWWQCRALYSNAPSIILGLGIENSTAPGLVVSAISMPGDDISSWRLISTNVWVPVLRQLNPSLVTWWAQDGSNSVATNATWMRDLFLMAGCKADFIAFASTPISTGSSEVPGQNSVWREMARTNQDFGYYDASSLFPTYLAITNKFGTDNGDGTHLPDKAQQYFTDAFLAQSDLLGMVRKSFNGPLNSAVGVTLQNPSGDTITSSSGGSYISFSSAGPYIGVNTNGQAGIGFSVFGSMSSLGANAGLSINDRSTAGATVIYRTANILRFYNGADYLTFADDGAIVTAGKVTAGSFKLPSPTGALTNLAMDASGNFVGVAAPTVSAGTLTNAVFLNSTNNSGALTGTNVNYGLETNSVALFTATVGGGIFDGSVNERRTIVATNASIFFTNMSMGRGYVATITNSGANVITWFYNGAAIYKYLTPTNLPANQETVISARLGPAGLFLSIGDTNSYWQGSPLYVLTNNTGAFGVTASGQPYLFLNTNGTPVVTPTNGPDAISISPLGAITFLASTNKVISPAAANIGNLTVGTNVVYPDVAWTASSQATNFIWDLSKPVQNISAAANIRVVAVSNGAASNFAQFPWVWITNTTGGDIFFDYTNTINAGCVFTNRIPTGKVASFSIADRASSDTIVGWVAP